MSKYLVVMMILLGGVCHSALVGKWLLNDDSQVSYVLDSSGNSHSLILRTVETAAATYLTHKGSTKGPCFTFTGATNTYNIAGNTDASDSTFNLHTNISIAAWVNIPSTTASHGIVSYYATNGPYALYYDGSENKINWLVGTCVAGHLATQATAVSIEGAWHHFVVTYDGSNLKTYLDKTKIGTDTAYTEGIKDDATQVFTIGSLSNRSIPLSGSICDVRLYSTALTQAEIDSIYDETKRTLTIVSTQAGFAGIDWSVSQDWELSNVGGDGSDGIYNLAADVTTSGAIVTLKPTAPTGTEAPVIIDGDDSTPYYKFTISSPAFTLGRPYAYTSLIFNQCLLQTVPTSNNVVGSFYNVTSRNSGIGTADAGFDVQGNNTYTSTVHCYDCISYNNGIADGFSLRSSTLDPVITVASTLYLHNCLAFGHWGSTSDGATTHDSHNLYIIGGRYEDNFHGVHSVDGSSTYITGGARFERNRYGVKIGDSTDTAICKGYISDKCIIKDNLYDGILAAGLAQVKYDDTTVFSGNAIDKATTQTGSNVSVSTPTIDSYGFPKKDSTPRRLSGGEKWTK